MNTTNGSRVFSVERTVDYESIHEFWEHRAALNGTVSTIGLTLFQDSNPEIAARRDEHEKKVILPQLTIDAGSNVLDIGCGTGRWGHEFIGKVGHYHGTDFSAGLIEVGREELSRAFPAGNFSLQVLGATEHSVERLDFKGPFDVVVISGLLAYLNDLDVSKVLASVPLLTSGAAMVYVREPVALYERLTLDRHFSNELAHHYSAVYRETAVYEQLFSKTLTKKGFVKTVGDFIDPDGIRVRTETAPHYWIFRRSESGGKQ